MLTLFHSPNSRSSSIVTLLDELGAMPQVQIEVVQIPRHDGSGGRDPANPHPEGKVPTLRHDGELIWERPAIMAYLTELFPQAGLGPQAGQPQRGSYLSWLAWYGDVMEPVMLAAAAGLSHPYFTATFRGPAEMAQRLVQALEKGPWLLGQHYSAADLLLHSPFVWFPEATPDHPAVKDWVQRCQARPAHARTQAFDAQCAAKLNPPRA